MLAKVQEIHFVLSMKGSLVSCLLLAKYVAGAEKHIKYPVPVADEYCLVHKFPLRKELSSF
jgi:hypothetical protein